MNYNNRCYRCFCELAEPDKPCPKCGYKHTPDATAQNCLSPGTMLNNRYIVGIALGIGGFGITYKCLDTKIGGICAVKEYFPAKFALRNQASPIVSISEGNTERYSKIMKRFVEEAELVKTLNHRNIIKIYDNFFANNTAYYVMEYCDGIDLRKYTNNFRRKLQYDEGMNLLYQIMNGLEYIHSKGILHRDIAPDNIYITKNNSVKILDFGSARNEMDQFNRELSVIVKVGYAPIEQYGGQGKQGPYTDIYALGATFYHLFTSKIPMESTQRVAEDNLEPLSSLRPDLPDNLKYCIEKAMAPKTSNRIANIAEMKSILGLSNTSIRNDSVIKKSLSGNSNFGNANNVQLRKRDVRPVYNQMANPNMPRNNMQFSIANRASTSLRIGAYLLDVLLWGIIYMAILMGTVGINSTSLGMGLLFPIILTIINTVSELLSSTTFGKAMLKMYIRGKTEVEVMPVQVLLRNIVKSLGIFVIIFAQGDNLLEDVVTDSIVCVRE